MCVFNSMASDTASKCFKMYHFPLTAFFFQLLSLDPLLSSLWDLLLWPLSLVVSLLDVHHPIPATFKTSFQSTHSITLSSHGPSFCSLLKHSMPVCRVLLTSPTTFRWSSCALANLTQTKTRFKGNLKGHYMIAQTMEICHSHKLWAHIIIMKVQARAEKFTTAQMPPGALAGVRSRK